MSASGTKRTCKCCRSISAFGGQGGHRLTVAYQPRFMSTRFRARRRHPRITPLPLCAEHMAREDPEEHRVRREQPERLAEHPSPSPISASSCAIPARRPQTHRAMRNAHSRRRLLSAGLFPSVAALSAPFGLSPAIGIVSHETRRALYFRQPLAPIFKPPGQPGYGDKRPS
jgi:hypothetical protein